MHIPVLLQAVIEALQPAANKNYIDGTVGAGGHATYLLQRTAPHGRLLGLDQDPMALALAQQNLADFAERVTLVQANFAQLQAVAAQNQFTAVDGILLDIGLSSMQLAHAERGFSFQQEGPLDMRMNPQLLESAATLVNTLPEKELADLIYQYGEETQSRRIARAIVQQRQNEPIERTTTLAEIVAQAKRTRSYRAAKIHPATQTFQALRIAVNDELGVLERVLPQALSLLKLGGRLAVISFHSLEDRIVKHFFKHESRDCICPPEIPYCVCNHQATVRLITRKPITADSVEIAENPRSRSAKLRVAELVKPYVNVK